jgi:hypothetical protein
MIFASTTLTELLPVLGVISAMLAGFFAIAKIMLAQATKDRDADRNERKEFSSAIERMAIATEVSARQATERNGHLAEISIQNKDAILKAIRSIVVNQKVSEQQVEHQVVKNKE